MLKLKAVDTLSVGVKFIVVEFLYDNVIVETELVVIVELLHKSLFSVTLI